MTGGGALNIGIHCAFEEELMKNVYVADHPQCNATIVSRQLIDADGYIGSFNLRLVAQIAMSVLGIVMAVKWVTENTAGIKDCEGCHSCAKLKGDDRIFLCVAGYSGWSNRCCVWNIQYGQPHPTANYHYRSAVKADYQRNTAIFGGKAD